MPRPSGLVRYLAIAVIFLFALYGLSSTTYDIQSSTFNPVAGIGKGKRHPIDKLIFDAQNRFAALVSKETKTVEQAAQAYRKRRGRHPPPGFDKWFEYAQSNNALIVEDFFDQIYHDLNPFWGVEPALMRRESSKFEMTINVRGGNATTGSNWFWTEIWLKMIKTFDHMLPDMDLPLNAMDEPRIVVPHEQIATYMDKAAKTFSLPKANKVVSEFQTLPSPGTGDLDVELRDKHWSSSTPFWPLARRGCPAESLARKTPLQDTFDKTPVFDFDNVKPHSYQGFVFNYTLSVDLCHQPDLQGLQGYLILPLTTSTCEVLFPLFGGSKLAVNNEILLPAPMYYNDEERFTGGDARGVGWAEKKNGVVWRGVATGGENNAENWKGFQRHRFVSMNNATTLLQAESGEKQPENFEFPDKAHGVAAQRDGKLNEWVQGWADVALTDLNCKPAGEKGHCNYTDHYFTPTKGVPMSEQFDHKYLPDIDGNSFSGRYRGFLKSSAVPIKSALWREWHDSRLVAWKHFVPMDSRFGDYYGIMEYFLGYGDMKGHDNAGEKIANDGQEWADQVLRKEDMQIYVFRLLLEYGRLLDERREQMGWVDDVIKNPALENKWKLWW